MNYEDTRIAKLREYLLDILDTLTNNEEYQINADMLDKEPENYSLNKIPTNPIWERWITGFTLYQETYSFRCRKAYSQDVVNNLSNIGFFEVFEKIIEENNKNKILPDINGIESIECLSSGTLNIAGTNTAVFDIQIRIIFHEED